MSDEVKLSAIRSRGERARALLDNDLLNEAFASLEAFYIDAWKTNARGAGPDGRERLWQAVQVLGDVRDHLEKMVSDGHLAEAELDALHPNHIR